MMLDNLYPRTKPDLLRAIQKMPINKIQIIDGYVSADDRELLKAVKTWLQAVMMSQLFWCDHDVI